MGNPVSEGSVTNWIRELENGSAEAAQRLWEAYYHRLVGLVRKKLADTPRRVADEDASDCMNARRLMSCSTSAEREA